jgi:uncharacterized membrane protein YccC
MLLVLARVGVLKALIGGALLGVLIVMILLMVVEKWIYQKLRLIVALLVVFFKLWQYK